MISETVENKANEVLLNMLEGAQNAGDFVVAQAPDMVRQLLLWHTVESLIGFLFGLLLLVGSPIAWVKLRRVFEQQKTNALEAYERGEKWTRFGSSRYTTSNKYDMIMGTTGIAAACVGLLGIFIGLICFFGNLVWLKILIAPKLYLLEYAAELVK